MAKRLFHRLSRISLWLSLARIYPSGHSTRRLSFTLATAFSVIAVVCVIGGIMGCPDTAWGTRFRPEICFSLQSVSDLNTYDKIAAAIAISENFNDSDLSELTLQPCSRCHFRCSARSRAAIPDVRRQAAPQAKSGRHPLWGRKLSAFMCHCVFLHFWLGYYRPEAL